ncbi:hypothetical protein BOTBODRAFT_25932 [Botryobasidium botryosum FD-172 SS1]|uniref:Uncharacterized protein n=1 Tax=Botryobasidium botryosum (strain FD-172 SS1) TaxID=930990 RepID=A0A067N3E0_BOTB1|nr:hypothetical protein BOTBODRAFT_25932 [Botryobasidium botryosum FD-172 SS1]
MAPTQSNKKMSMKELQAANDALQAKLEQSQQKYSQLDIKYRKNKAAQKKLRRDVVVIPKPKGEHGRDFNVQCEMGLDGPGRRGLYLNILATVRDLIAAEGLDRTLWFRQQDPVKMARLYVTARDRFPLLKQFRNDWATAEIVKQALRNSRHNSRNKGAVPNSGIGPTFENGNADEMMDDESGSDAE